MGIAVERNNFVGVGRMVAQLCRDMAANGFDAIYVDGAIAQGSTPTFDQTMQRVIFAATQAVDPLAIEDSDTSNPDFDKRQPWRFVIEVDDVKQTIRWYACTPTNILDDWTVATSRTRMNPAVGGSSGQFDTFTQKSGFMYAFASTLTNGVDSTASLLSGDEASDWLTVRRRDGQALQTIKDVDRYSFRYEHFGYDVNGTGAAKVNVESIPLSYRLAISDHGIAFCMWIESKDSEGNHFHWWNVQRMVNKDNGEPIVDGKAPLFCVFSMKGGGGADVNVADLNAVHYFVVREIDVNAPTFPVSASVDTADSNRIINVVQQVSISEENKLVISMMKGLNSQRYAYPHELDMIGYVSADVVSQWADIEVEQYGEGEENKRSFKAMQSNFRNNSGMRILMIQRGAGIE